MPVCIGFTPRWSSATAAGERVRGEEERAERPADHRREVQEHEATAAEHRLEERTELVQEQHVHGDVERPEVEEPGADDAPPLTAGHEDLGEAQLDLARRCPAAERTRTTEPAPHEHGDVHRHQDAGREGRLRGVPPAHALRTRGAGGAHAVEALRPD
jgi:hypothetical protein